MPSSLRSRATIARTNPRADDFEKYFSGRLKDEYGARHVRFSGNVEVYCQLMFSLFVLTVDQIQPQLV